MGAVDKPGNSLMRATPLVYVSHHGDSLYIMGVQFDIVGGRIWSMASFTPSFRPFCFSSEAIASWDTSTKLTNIRVPGAPILLKRY